MFSRGSSVGPHMFKETKVMYLKDIGFNDDSCQVAVSYPEHSTQTKNGHLDLIQDHLNKSQDHNLHQQTSDE